MLFYRSQNLLLRLLLCLLYLLPARATLAKPIPPGRKLHLMDTVGPDDQQLALTISNLSKDPHLRFKITTPGKSPHSKDSSSDADGDSDEESFDVFGSELPASFNKYYSAPGSYYVTLFNSGKKEIEVQITSYVYKKINESNKDIVELRNLLDNLQTTVDKLGGENYFLRNVQRDSIGDARRVLRAMNWLLAFPVLTVLVGYVKYVLAKQMVKPKGKRFKGLF